MFGVVPSALSIVGIVVTCFGVALAAWRQPAPLPEPLRLRSRWNARNPAGLDPVSLFANLLRACAASLATHYVASTPPRAKRAGALGEKGCLGICSLAAFATLGWMDRPKAATLGEGWRRFAAVTSNLPFAAIAAGPQALRRGGRGGTREYEMGNPGPGAPRFRFTIHDLRFTVRVDQDQGRARARRASFIRAVPRGKGRCSGCWSRATGRSARSTR